jgi:hypothetical protein
MCDPQDDACRTEKEIAFDGWRQYPANVILEPAAINVQYYNDKIADVRSHIFSDSSSDTDVEIMDIIGKTFSSSPGFPLLTEPGSHRRSKHSIQNTISYEPRRRAPHVSNNSSNSKNHVKNRLLTQPQLHTYCDK